MSAQAENLRDAVWAELLSCYGEGEDTDWPYLTDLTDLIVDMIGRHSKVPDAAARVAARRAAGWGPHRDGCGFLQWFKPDSNQWESMDDPEAGVVLAEIRGAG